MPTIYDGLFPQGTLLTAPTMRGLVARTSSVTDTRTSTAEVDVDPVKYRDVVKLLERDGWLVVRQVGSHRQYAHPTKPGIVTITHHGLGADVPVGTLRSILKQAGLK
jgi:predicted RNA binding protein YcfA (HicA-like mRNA interferase family)